MCNPAQRKIIVKHYFFLILLSLLFIPLPATAEDVPVPIQSPVPHRFVTVPAHPCGEGFGCTQVRDDFQDAYMRVFNEVIGYRGGLLTSSGGKRPLDAKVTPGRSGTSLHYLGRAIDLYIYTGMQGATDPYIITRDGGTERNPRWKVYCVVDDTRAPEQTLTGYIWRKGQEPEPFQRTARVICLSDIFKKHGWRSISSRSDWKDNYLSLEWWHFQRDDGMVQDTSTFMDELRKMYTEEEIAESPLAGVDATWDDGGFKVRKPKE